MLKIINSAVNTYFGVCAYCRKVWFDVAMILLIRPLFAESLLHRLGISRLTFQPQKSSGKMITIRDSRGDYRSNVTIKQKENRLHIITSRRAFPASEEDQTA